MDGALVYGATQTEHDEHLEAVLQTIQAHGMTLIKINVSFLKQRYYSLDKKLVNMELSLIQQK